MEYLVIPLIFFIVFVGVPVGQSFANFLDARADHYRRGGQD